MSFTDLSGALVAAAAPGPGFGMMDFLFIGGFILIFYFLLWRPQSKRRKEHQALMGGLSAGDEVVTSGGIVGEIRKVGENFVTLQVAPNIQFRVQKTAVGATLPKGTIKNIDE